MKLVCNIFSACTAYDRECTRLPDMMFFDDGVEKCKLAGYDGILTIPDAITDKAGLAQLMDDLG